MAELIPIRNFPEFTEDITLDGTAYKFRFKQNFRGQFDTLDVLTKEGVVLVAGMKLCLNTSLFKRHPGRGLPPGELFVVDLSGNNDVIEFEDFDGRIVLFYYTEDELA